MIKKMRERLKNQKGMTLIELLAVIVILGIIAAIAIPSIGNIIQNTKIDAVKSDAIQIINAAKMYNSASNVPSDTTVSVADLEGYVDLETKWTGAGVTITFTDGKASYELNAVGTANDGETTVTFTDANITDINNAKKGAVTIP